MNFRFSGQASQTADRAEAFFFRRPWDHEFEQRGAPRQLRFRPLIRSGRTIGSLVANSTRLVSGPRRRLFDSAAVARSRWRTDSVGSSRNGRSSRLCSSPRSAAALAMRFVENQCKRHPAMALPIGRRYAQADPPPRPITGRSRDFDRRARASSIQRELTCLDLAASAAHRKQSRQQSYPGRWWRKPEWQRLQTLGVGGPPCGVSVGRQACGDRARRARAKPAKLRAVGTLDDDGVGAGADAGPMMVEVIVPAFRVEMLIICSRYRVSRIGRGLPPMVGYRRPVLHQVRRALMVLSCAGSPRVQVRVL